MRVFFPKFNRDEVAAKIREYAAELREKLGLEKVVLFGSYAKGTYTAASDIDLLIVFDDEKSSEGTVYRTLMKNIKLPRMELHLIPKSELPSYEGTRWMRLVEREGIRIL
ncbi:MAG: nucleotidyltransferase domain-containing protein [Candidatus Bathyarchaeia archaeon]|nr:nucleotidyltransferase domain-containing protein [Candidatus Bathyarchaeota archaeon]